MINRAFDTYSTPWYSFDKTKAEKELDDVVLKEIYKIYEYVSKYDVDWEKDTMEAILQKLEKDIAVAYPYLSNKAVNILKNYFAYEWK